MSDSTNLFASLTNPVEKATEPTKTQTTARPPEPQRVSQQASNPVPMVPDSTEPAQPTELEMLKQRADMMGIGYSNNIGVDALKQKIEDKINPPSTEIAGAPKQATDTVTELEAPVPQKSLRQHLYEEAMRLVRVRIQNLDPKKKDLPGEIVCVANEHLGAVKKFVPFGEVTDKGYHIPYILYEELKNRTFLNIRVVKRNNREHVETGYAKEFAIEILEPLTEKELNDLAIAQQASGSIE